MRGVVQSGQLKDLEDDALIHQESESSVCCCIAALTEKERCFITESLQQTSHDLHDTFSSFPVSTCDLLEICCGPMSGLTQAVLEKGGVGYRVGVHNGMDLTTNMGYERARQFANEVRPRWMMISTPCGPTSNIQNLNQKTPRQIKHLKQKRRKARTIVKHALALARDQVLRFAGSCRTWSAQVAGTGCDWMAARWG